MRRRRRTHKAATPSMMIGGCLPFRSWQISWSGNAPIHASTSPYFPIRRPAFYWTASDRRGKGNEGEAYVLSFGPEGTGGDVKNERHFVRLVRAVAH